MTSKFWKSVVLYTSCRTETPAQATSQNQCSANTGKSWSTVQRDEAETRSGWAVHREGLWLPKHSENWGALLTFRLPETKGSSVLTEPGITSHPRQKMLSKAWNTERDEKVERGREKKGMHERKWELEKETKTLWSWEKETGDRKRVIMWEEEGKGEAQDRKRYDTWGINSSACKTKNF